jgi:dienelactone hydrolase
LSRTRKQALVKRKLRMLTLIEKRRKKMEPSPTRDGFLALLGECSAQQPPLDIEVIDEAEHESHTLKLIEYATVPGERVQAYLLLPGGDDGPKPGILAIHQDGAARPYQYGGSEPAGVAGDPELPYGLELCQRGYVVICPDRFPFGSRSLAQSTHRETFAQFPVFGRYQGQELDLTEDLYRGCMANRLLFEGWTLMGKTLYELQRALDVLCALPDANADGERLSAIGHSAGGFLTALLMFVDPRIVVGCASSGTFLIRNIYSPARLRPINGFGSMLAVPGMAKWGDIDDVLAGLAPRPYLETHGDFTQDMVDEKSAKARARYKALGVEDRYQSMIYDAGAHVFRADMREKSVDWFDRWLKGTGE